MTTIGADEAETKLAHLLDEVAAARTVTITRHGREVARLVPADGGNEPGEVIEALRRARIGVAAAALICGR